jgi:hypothetical protein
MKGSKVRSQKSVVSSQNQTKVFLLTTDYWLLATLLAFSHQPGKTR